LHRRTGCPVLGRTAPDARYRPRPAYGIWRRSGLRRRAARRVRTARRKPTGIRALTARGAAPFRKWYRDRCVARRASIRRAHDRALGCGGTASRSAIANLFGGGPDRDEGV